MQSVHGTGEPGLDAIKVTNWNLANKVVTLAYFQGKMNFFGNCFPKKQSDNKRVTSNPKKHKKISQPCHHFLYPSIRMILQSHLFLFFTFRSFSCNKPMSSSLSSSGSSRKPFNSSSSNLQILDFCILEDIPVANQFISHSNTCESL